MIRGVLTLSAVISPVLFPWPLTVVLVLAASVLEPLTPLAVGLFADTLYYVPHAGALPLFTLGGALLSAGMFFVRARLNTGSIRE